MKLDDDGKLYSKWLNKRNNAKAEGIKFLLSYEEWCSLVEEASLKSSDLGFSGRKFVLARFEDKGPYRVGNCRFITQKENAAEKRPLSKVAKAKAAKARAATRARKLIKDPDFYRLSESTKVKIRDSAYHRARIEDGVKAKQKRFDAAHPSYRGSKNSQFGSFWITNGESNKKWHSDKGKLPRGFYKGRAT